VTAKKDDTVAAKSEAEKKALADKILKMTGNEAAVEKAAASATAGAEQVNPQHPHAPAGMLPQANPMDGMSSCMDKFRETFEASARRWELIVYPSLLAFIVLAAYGFYLIQSLTTDMGRIADRIDGMGDDMRVVSTSVVRMTDQMDVVTVQMSQISNRVASQDQSLRVVAGQMNQINQSTQAISGTMQQMRHEMSAMGYNLHSASGPMRMMNGFMPW
jgi:hypothetical protein